MAPIDRPVVDLERVVATHGDDIWRAIAGHAAAWVDGAALGMRDVIVLVPFVQLLPLARSAFAAASGWMPRIETTRTLAATLGPPMPTTVGGPSLDVALDGMQARQMLARQGWGATWRRNDLRGFERGAARLVSTTHELVAAVARVAPDARDAWWATARESVRAGSGPAARERALSQIALEWAALAPPSITDRLFSLRPAGWISVQAGGADRLVRSLLATARTPCLVLDTDASLDAPFEAVVPNEPPTVADCASFEDEAEAAAAQILAHLGKEQRPVALIAQDRVLVRRVRALLERAGASMRDETGWKLSTTRAAAQLMTLLVVARRGASADAFFEWLKSGTRWPRDARFGVAVLEAQCRKKAAWQLDAIARLELDDDAAAKVRKESLAAIDHLREPSRRTLAAWLDASAAALRDAGALAAMRADAAGQQLIATLGLDNAGVDSAPTEGAGESLNLAEFTQWVDETLEAATFRADGDAVDRTTFDAVDVVVTPLARAMLRPFAAAVLPGADDARLGAFAADDSLLSRGTREALGLPGPKDRLDAELLAFAQLLRLPRVTMLHRRADGGESLAASPLLERLSLALAEREARFLPWVDPRVDMPVTPNATSRTAAVAPSLVPTRLSATSFEALRACPYRFFARSMLALAEDAELDGDLEKRDYGNWLHQVLHQFHEQRAALPGTRARDEDALRAAGDAAIASLGFDAAEFLPWSASFEAFVPRYLRWLRDREAGGAHWARGEAAIKTRPDVLEGVELQGRIDRVDERGSGAQATLELIDYKTGSEGGLKKRVNDPSEDTQLAFYAALVGADDARPIKATYLALEARPDLKEHEHRDVRASADALVEGIAIDLGRLRGGAGLMPLGEGDACGYCEARGLCRRDHWSAILPDAGVEEGA